MLGLAVLWVGIAGCGTGVPGVSAGSDTMPYPFGPWSAQDQKAFLQGCEGPNTTAGYCNCALGSVMQKYSDPAMLSGNPASATFTSGIAARHKRDYASCKGK
jgi:hypothetical protein